MSKQQSNELLSAQAKRELLFCYDVAQLSKLSQHRAASILNISVATLRNILKNRKGIEEQRLMADTTGKDEFRGLCPREKRQTDCSRRPVDVMMEEGMARWLDRASSLNVRVTKTILLDKAGSLATVLGVENFSATDEWIDQWKNKYCNIASRKLCRGPVGAESDPKNCTGAYFSATNDRGPIKSVREFFENVVSNYRADDVYSLFEIGLYYRDDLPNPDCEFRGGTSLQYPDDLPNPDCVFGGRPATRTCGDDAGCRRPRFVHRLSVVFASNISGTDKMRPVVVDNVHIPRYLQDVRALSEHFRAGYDTWMTSCYASILTRLDAQLPSERKILVIVDNATVDLHRVRLENVEIKYLPSAAVVSVHPLRQNVVRIAKTYEYYLKQTKSATARETVQPNSYDSPGISVSDSVHMIFDVWENCTSPALIRNCFRKIGFLRTENEEIYEDLHLNFTRWIFNYRHYLWTFFQQLRNENTTQPVISSRNDLRNSVVRLHAAENNQNFRRLRTIPHLQYLQTTENEPNYTSCRRDE